MQELAPTLPQLLEQTLLPKTGQQGMAGYLQLMTLCKYHDGCTGCM